MGSDDFYPEEAPVHEVEVDGFWIDEHPVTVAAFRRFVKDTGYVTVAERTPDTADFPGRRSRPARTRVARCSPTRPAGRLRDPSNWWAYRPEPSGAIPGAGEHAARPGASSGHPVAWEDVAAYAAWAGKEVPTEAEWEYAARGGLEGATFAWGEEFAPKGRMMANTWQGEFPWQNLVGDGYKGTSPVKSFPPNGYGLVDMGGNVWEWTSDYFTPASAAPTSLLRPAEPPRMSAPDAPRRARRAHPPAGDQGRVAPVRAQLLPSLPARGAAERDRRHVDEPHRLPLRRPVTRGSWRT